MLLLLALLVCHYILLVHPCILRRNHISDVSICCRSFFMAPSTLNYIRGFGITIRTLAEFLACFILYCSCYGTTHLIFWNMFIFWCSHYHPHTLYCILDIQNVTLFQCPILNNSFYPTGYTPLNDITSVFFYLLVTLSCISGLECWVWKWLVVGYVWYLAVKIDRMKIELSLGCCYCVV